MSEPPKSQETEQRFLQMAEHWPEMPYRMSLPDGSYEFVGRASIEIFGYTPEQFLESPLLIRSVIHPDWLEYFQEQWQALVTGKAPPFYEYQIVHGRSGETRWIHQRNLLVCDDRGHPVAIEGIVADATDRIQAEEAHRRERELTDAAFDAQRDTFFLFEPNTGKAIRWNRSFREISGYSDEEISEMPAPASYYRPEDLERTHDFVQQLSEADTGTIELDLICKDGRAVPTEYSVSVVLDTAGAPRYLISVGRDVSERKKAEKEVRTQRQRLMRFMDSATDSFHLVDSDLRIIEISESAMGTLRGVVPGVASKDDVIGKTLLDIYPFMRGEGGELRFRKVIKSGEPIQFDDSPEHPVHGTVHLTVQAFKVGDDLGITATDISARKRAEEERLRLERQVQHDQKLESLGLLAGGIAHDFNNLLVGVLGGTDLALGQIPRSSPVRPLLEDVAKAARRAAELANQMLAYSGKGRFIVEPRDISELVHDMFKLIEASVPKKIRLAYELDETLPAAEVDVTQIRQIVLNLVINAAEAIGKETGTISLTSGSLHCTREYLTQVYLGDEAAEGVYVYLQVEDTGSGMEDGAVQKIFDPFFTTKSTGRGLGLAAVLGIVRGHQGGINVESRTGEGTKITVLFPACEKTALSRTKDSAEQDQWIGHGTILLVDDEEAVRTVTSSMLRKLGFDVLLAENGREGVDVFRQHATEIALVLLDLSMPKMNGDEAFREIRLIKNDARVILSSGFTEQDVKSQLAAAGVAGFIQKPYRLRELTQKLRHVIDS